MEVMHYVMGLPLGKLPYEEYIPCDKELEISKKEVLELYMTYWEVMYHYLICTETRAMRHGGVSCLN